MTDDFITFFVAGQETTANTLAFCFLEMGKNPEIVKKAREEIDRVLGQRTEVTYQDVSELKYCMAIFKEALRLYPPAPSIGRQIKDDMTINGYHLPAETSVFVRKTKLLLYKKKVNFLNSNLLSDLDICKWKIRKVF